MHYAVIDEEFCNVTRAERTKVYNLKNEIIQIGIVLLDENYDLIDEFNAYIKPEYGHIDSFIMNLTGISEKMISESEKLNEVLERLHKWLPEDAVMVSWSMHDRKQLFTETTAKQIDVSWLDDKFETWTDSQEEFGKKLGSRKAYRLEEAIFLSDVFPKGNMHDGLADAYNTAMLLKKIRTEEHFTMNVNYVKADDESIGITYSLANLIDGLVIA